MVGRPLRLMLMSDAVGASVTVVELLPPVVVPPLTSFGAPVVTVTMLDTVDVGVPVTGQLMLAPAATVAGGTGVHVPTVSPAGRPAIAHVADVALAVAAALLVHKIVPEYGEPTVIVVGIPDTSGVISDPTVAIVCVAELLPPAPVPPLVSLVAPVVALAVVDPAAVGVPDTGQMMLVPAATLAGGTGEHAPTVTPGGSPETAHVAFAAAAVALALLVHLIVPE